ncbi:MAG TPA: hypothetical protein VGH28_27085, partial [Polyangiaceae bacterium]
MKLSLDELGVDAEDADAIGQRKVMVACEIAVALLDVNGAVELDDEAVRGDEEVGDVRMKRMLPPH